MKTDPQSKVISFDVYGTILCADDPENCMPPRKGFIEFVSFCQSYGIYVVTSSDNSTPLTKIDLSESGVSLELFHSHYQMNKGEAKNFKPILDFFAIESKELLVFGDRIDLDINPAILQGCRAILVPPYTHNDTFDWMSMASEI